MIAGIVGAIARTVIGASVDQHGGGRRRAYYNWVVTTAACLPLAVFLLIFVGGAVNVANGYGSGWQIALLGLAMTVGYAALVGRQIIRREAVWDAKGVRFRWLGGEADLAWSEIEKVEIRPFSKGYARIRFRDGRTFGIGAQCTGCNALLRELGRHGIPFHKWGTSKPLNAA